MKNIYVSCYTSNEWADDVPNLVHITLTETIVEKLNAMAQALEKTNCYEINFFYYGVEYYQYYESELTPESLQPFDPMRMECQLAVVSRMDEGRYEVSFEAIPKHCSDIDRVTTARISLDDINSNDEIMQWEF